MHKNLIYHVNAIPIECQKVLVCSVLILLWLLSSLMSWFYNVFGRRNAKRHTRQPSQTVGRVHPHADQNFLPNHHTQNSVQLVQQYGPWSTDWQGGPERRSACLESRCRKRRGPWTQGETCHSTRCATQSVTLRVGGVGGHGGGGALTADRHTWSSKCEQRKP